MASIITPAVFLLIMLVASYYLGFLSEDRKLSWFKVLIVSVSFIVGWISLELFK